MTQAAIIQAKCSKKEAEDRASTVSDKLGLSLDEKITPIVAGLHRYGIKTQASCQGHEDWGNSYPWVEIALSSLDDLKQLFGHTLLKFEVQEFGVDVDHYAGLLLPKKVIVKESLTKPHTNYQALNCERNSWQQQLLVVGEKLLDQDSFEIIA